ncbi:hypothetical protein [Pseudomonas sp. PL-6]
MDSEFRHLAEALRLEVERKLTACGILCRVFGRGKDGASLLKKIKAVCENTGTLKYSQGGKKIQDAIGIRVVLYFSDDIEIARKILCDAYSFYESDSAIDRPGSEEFSVTRYNLVFEVPSIYSADMIQNIYERPIDTTFEVQVRSVLSEGWHEVEHDLRYKKKEHWLGNDDLSRALNGIAAALETSEWGMRKIFEDLAYRHYKKQSWEAMLNLKFRMRMAGGLGDALKDIFDTEREVPKRLLRVDRGRVLSAYADKFSSLPLTVDNVVYVSNLIFDISDNVLNVTPSRIKKLAG